MADADVPHAEHPQAEEAIIAPPSEPDYSDSLITPEDTIFLCNLSPGLVRKEFMGSVINALGFDRTHLDVLRGPYLVTAGGVMGVYRNQAVEVFLNNTDCRWLLFIDSDIVFSPTAPYELLETALAYDTQIASGIYVLPQSQGTVLSCYHLELDPKYRLMRMKPLNLDRYPQGEVYYADGCGAGFLLIHRDVLMRFKEFYNPTHTWFAEDAIDGVIHGEDLTFCRRAKAIGYQIAFDPEIRLGHVKEQILMAQIPQLPQPQGDQNGSN